jgi:GT2 family glycosyltransferase
MVDQVMGAFFLVRRSLFEDLKGFDERFFVYYEEVDFARRASTLGWSSFYLAQAQAFHSGGGTSRQVKAKRLFYFLRSGILYAFKHFSPIAASLVLFVTLLLEPLSRTALAVVRRSWSSLPETWSAYLMLYRWLLGWFEKGETR